MIFISVESEKSMEISGTDGNEVTIIHVLGIQLCARAILDHVPLRDLVRSERVSRQWRHIVHEYLQRQPLTLFDAYSERSWWITDILRRRSHRNINIPSVGRDLRLILPLLLKTVQKWGSAVVKLITNRYYGEYLEIIASNCHDLQHIEFCEIREVNLPFLNEIKQCKKLKQISFKFPFNMSDNGLGDVCLNVDCEKIEVDYTRSKTPITFSFLKCIKPTSNLKSLSLHDGQLFLSRLPSEIQTLSNITSLELDHNNLSVFENVHLLLKKMPNLENLSLCEYHYYKELSGELIDSFTRLSNMKCLKMRSNHGVTNALLEALAQGCSKLEYVDISHILVGARGVAALCRMPQPMVIKLSYDVQDIHTRTDKQLLARAKSMSFFSECESLGMKLTWYPQMQRTRNQQGQERLVLKVGAAHADGTQHKLKILLY